MMIVRSTLMRMNEQEMAKQKNMTAAVREFSRIPPNLNLFSNMVKLKGNRVMAPQISTEIYIGKAFF